MASLELRTIWHRSNDPAWNAATIRVHGRLSQVNNLANLLGDVYANQPVRAAVLETVVSLNDPGLATARSTVDRDVGLEGSLLLQAIDGRLVLRKDRIKL
jgi:hypothetical protein